MSVTQMPVLECGESADVHVHGRVTRARYHNMEAASRTITCQACQVSLLLEAGQCCANPVTICELRGRERASVQPGDPFISSDMRASLLCLLPVLLATAALTICRASHQPTDGSSLLSPGFHPLPCPSPPSSSLCGRAYYPHFLSPANASLLLSLATAAFEHTPGGSGPVTIVDMVSGALSYNDKSVFAVTLPVVINPAACL